MTREEAKHFWPIIKAYSEGKTVEYLLSEGKWAAINEYGLPESVKVDSPCMDDYWKGIWHDVDEAPKAGKWIVIHKNQYDKYVEVTMSWEEIKSNYDFSEWAYADDFAKIGGKEELE